MMHVNVKQLHIISENRFQSVLNFSFLHLEESSELEIRVVLGVVIKPQIIFVNLSFNQTYP
jgi:hypothetical protein